jgi:MFS family permease
MYNLFESKYRISPALTTSYLFLFGLPWFPKLIYGIIVDTVPICGSTKRAYLILVGSIQLIALMMAAVFNNYNPDAPDRGASSVVWWLVLYSMGQAFMETVC